VGLLLARVHLGAAASLEPVLALLGTLARDLRADFLPLLQRVLERITQLVESGGRCAPLSSLWQKPSAQASRSCCIPAHACCQQAG
jgi:hypothetical protein